MPGSPSVPTHPSCTPPLSSSVFHQTQVSLTDLIKTKLSVSIQLGESLTALQTSCWCSLAPGLALHAFPLSAPSLASCTVAQHSVSAGPSLPMPCTKAVHSVLLLPFSLCKKKQLLLLAVRQTQPALPQNPPRQDPDGRKGMCVVKLGHLCKE